MATLHWPVFPPACTTIISVVLLQQTFANVSKDCVPARSNGELDLPPWWPSTSRGLIIEQNLSAMSLSRLSAFPWHHVSHDAAQKAAAGFEFFITQVHLDRELTNAERESYKRRFVSHMQFVLECEHANSSWQLLASKALEFEKPRLTQALSLRLTHLGAPQGVILDEPTRTSSPPNIARESTTYDWCDCATGLESLVFWSANEPEKRVIVTSQSVRWLVFSSETKEVKWICNGMSRAASSKLSVGSKIWSIQLFPVAKSTCFFSSTKMSGRIRVNSWSPTTYSSSVPFTGNSEGYACMKIPAMLRTDQGTLLAFAEARTPNCSDFAETHLVYKRSTDGGRTWSALNVVNSSETDKGLCGAALVIGNAAPVQLSRTSRRHPGRILLPHVHNNFHAWIAHSDDDGITWSSSVRIPNVTNTASSPDCERGMLYYGFDIDSIDLKNIPEVVRFAKQLGWGKDNPFGTPGWRAKMHGPWQFMGLGPPGSLQLSSGRVLTPGYHSWIRGLPGGDGSPGKLPVSQLYNDLAFGHVMISDDDGDTWYLRSEHGFGHGAGQGANENQMVQLPNGSILTNSRSFATGTLQRRVQSRSDDDGETFTSTTFVQDLPEPFNGCQGSIVRGANNTVYLSHPDPAQGSGFLPALARSLEAFVNLTGRDHMTIFRSTDGGSTYPVKMLIDAGPSGQSSLQYYDGKLGLLYEQVDPDPSSMTNWLTGSINIEVPTRFVFREIDENALPLDSFGAQASEIFV